MFCYHSHNSSSDEYQIDRNISYWFKNNITTISLLLGRAQDSQGDAVVKNPAANTGDAGDMISIPGLGRYPRGGNGNPLQYSCLENPMDRDAWWAIFP